MGKILYLLVAYMCFTSLFTPCYTMELDEEPVPRLSKRPSESNNDIALHETKKISEEQPIKQDWSSASYQQQQFHPPLELWEQFLASLSEAQKKALFNYIDNCQRDFPLETLHAKVREFIKFRHNNRYYDTSPSLLINEITFENFRALEMLYDGLKGIYFFEDKMLYNGAESEQFFYKSYFAKLDINLDRVKDNSYFSTWYKVLTSAAIFPNEYVSEEVRNIIKNVAHPQCLPAYYLYLTVKYLNAYLRVLFTAHRIVYMEYAPQIPHFQAMLDAGYQKFFETWKFVANDITIAPVGYYFLSDYADDCPEEWMDIYDKYSVLGSESIVKTEDFKSLLKLYHAINKSEENVPRQIKMLKRMINYVDSCSVKNPFFYREKIQHLKLKQSKLRIFCSNLEDIKQEISPQQLKERIVLALGEELLLDLTEKLNIDFDDNYNFDKGEEARAEILDFYNGKYKKLCHKIDVLQDKVEKNEWEVLQDLRTRAKKRINFLKELATLREKAQRVIENSETELLALWPFIEGFLTFLDPLKREGLQEELIKWQDLVKADATIPNFFFWLDNVADLVSIKDKFLVDDAKVQFSKGVAYNTFWTKMDDQPLEGVYLYIVSPDRSLYIAPECDNLEITIDINDINKNFFYTHRDISKEPWAIGAGQMIFRKGKIIYINRQSGHYRPEKKHLDYVVSSLKQKYGKDIFSSELMIDSCLTTTITLKTPTDIIFSRKIMEEGYEEAYLSDAARFKEKKLTLFDLGFKN